ncbi:DUF4349 domain-containing protein [Terrabacter sp. BE26]|uniref:DUF4349 domain-containing protein n=1 Tax=Terrabacter sp. BE26 TaxID=2898152 RepID=UPI0035BE9155
MTALSHLPRPSSGPAQPPSEAPRQSPRQSSPEPSPAPSARRGLVVAAAAAVVLLGLAVPLGLRGVTGGSVAGSADARVSAGAGAPARAGNGSAGAAVAPSAPSAPSGPAAGKQGAQAPSTSAGASDSVVGPKIARTAWLGLKVTDLAGAAARARVVATDAGGQVTSENVVTSIDPTGGPTGDPVGPLSGGVTSSPGLQSPSRSTASLQEVGVDQARMVLNVPAKALDEVLTQLSRLGTVSYRSSQSEDVTDSYVDTKARIQPMRDGIDRVRALLAKATDLQQIITLESELTRRQADLDSLTQRLAQLDAVTTSSDVTVSLWTAATTGPTPAPSGNGIVTGLRSAWDSLLGSLTVVLTGLAALLPWLLVLVPLGLLALRLWRRRGAGAAPAASTSSPPAVPAASTPASGGSASTGTSSTGTSSTGTSSASGTSDPDR